MNWLKKGAIDREVNRMTDAVIQETIDYYINRINNHRDDFEDIYPKAVYWYYPKDQIKAIIEGLAKKLGVDVPANFNEKLESMASADRLADVDYRGFWEGKDHSLFPVITEKKPDILVPVKTKNEVNIPYVVYVPNDDSERDAEVIYRFNYTYFPNAKEGELEDVYLSGIRFLDTNEMVTEADLIKIVNFQGEEHFYDVFNDFMKDNLEDYLQGE